MSKRVFLGMSGGVDSSVSAVLLKNQGYDVAGIYMKNWSEDLPGMKCPWAEDLADAKRVAVGLDIDFEVWDFEEAYKREVVDYMLVEFKKGRTPNPDVVCNELVKFKLFYERALARGADYIATGHYARVSANQNRSSEALHSLLPELFANCVGDEQKERGSFFFESTPTEDTLCRTNGEQPKRGVPVTNPVGARAESRACSSSCEATPRNLSKAKTGNDEACSERRECKAPEVPLLLRAVDENKDQTYFLYRMSDEALSRTIFPLGEMTKPEVKAYARAEGLDVASKKESMGVCFVGEVGMKDFLSRYIDTKPGEIREQETGQKLGYHDGAIFYTLGQRHGLYLGGGLPYYVVDKDLVKNIVYVSKNLNHPGLWAKELEITDLFLRAGVNVKKLMQVQDLQVRLRHRAPLIPVKLEQAGEVTKLAFSEPIKRPAAGQSAVLYAGEVCLGGGIISE